MSRTLVAGTWLAFFQECQQQSCGQDLLLVVGFSRGDLLTRFPDSKTILPKLFSHHLARFGAFPISYLFTQEYNCFTCTCAAPFASSSFFL
eukprot:COSAG04_NODE_3671_length_2617_cov_1.837172_4_plen_91_part_00